MTAAGRPGISTARSARVLFAALAAVATAGCDDRVPIGSWDRELTRTGGTAGEGSPQNGGIGGAPENGGAGADSAGAGNGGAHVCGMPGDAGPFNPAGDDAGVTVTYTDWTWPSPVDSIEWDFEGESDFQEDGYFWTLQFAFSGSNAVGLLGLQARGGFQPDPPRGPISVTNMAIFWVSSSPLRAMLGDVAYPDARIYEQDDGSTEWLTIHARYDWQSCRFYRLRVGRLSTEDSGDIWYGAWIRDLQSGAETFVGRILVPASWGKLGTSSSMWSNRIGYASVTSCSTPEPASAFFGTPTADNGAVRPLSLTPKNRFSILPQCPTSRFTEFPDGVRHELGVTRP